MVSSKTAPDPLIGRALGEFVIRGKIGEGAAGAVYRADQPMLDREVVVKILHARHRADPTIVQRFTKEARLASRLEHPYAAHVYAFGAEPDGILWIAMELVRGTPLAEVLQTRGPLPLERLVPLVEKICDVVHTAHEQDIVHRDLKPANVMIMVRGGRWFPKLLDFGIAKGLEGAGASATRTVDDERDTPGDTVHGMGLGSPPYMAPEQWEDAATVDARTDLYALGVLTYEALTGRCPFIRRTLRALSRAHRRDPLPPLGDAFPGELGAVLTCALAKKREDRFATALDFAAALRTAAHLGDESESLPGLDEPLTDVVLAHAPQPIADAVAALDTARNRHEARARAGDVVRTAVRYVGLLALACRTQVGTDTVASPTADTLRDLRRRCLRDDEWPDLARALCRPFAHQRDAYPIPELVSLFFDRESDRDRDPDPLTTALAAISVREPTPESLRACMRDVAAMLRAIAFTSDYALVIPQDERGLRWMGTARRNRSPVPLQGVRLDAGRPILIDGDGRPVLALWPLLQVARPTPEAAEELFLFDGHGPRGAQLTALPTGFQLIDDHVWEWFRRHLFDQPDATDRTAAERSPYPGLATYTTADADIFVGREREVEVFLNRLRAQPLLAVVGPSGAGKSSFVQAGVLPHLPADWRALLVRPGTAPVAALAGCLSAMDIGREDLATELTADPDALGKRLRAAASDGATLVLVIDQFEELFTLCAEERDRSLIATALASAARSVDDPVRIIVTLRDDFLGRAEQLAPLRHRISRGLQFLTTPARDDLVRILVEPAQRAGYQFEDASLPRAMADEVAGNPGALPLLAFTAARLWELRDRHFKQLHHRAYDTLGGVGGALAQHSEATLTGMSAEDQRLVREAFRHLLTSEGTRAILTRSELEQVLGQGSRASDVIESLITARLLVAREGPEAADRIEIVHEALLTAWPRLIDWRREDAEGARLRDQLRVAAKQWDQRGRGKGLLWRGEALTEYRLWRDRYAGALTMLEEAFAEASQRESRRGQRWRRTALATAFVVLSAGTASMTYLRNDAVRATARVERQLAKSYIDQGRIAYLRGDTYGALRFLYEGNRRGADSPGARYLAARALEPVRAYTRSLWHDEKLWRAVFSPDGASLVTTTSAGRVSVWNAATGERKMQLRGHDDTVNQLAFSPDGRYLVAAGTGPKAILWDLASGRRVGDLDGHSDACLTIAFAAGQVATGDAAGTVRIWHGESGQLLQSWPAAASHLWATAFDRAAQRLVTGDEQGRVVVWDVRTATPVAQLVGHEAAVRRLLFLGDDRRVVTASHDGTARVFHASDGQVEQVLRGHTGPIEWVDVNREETLLVTASADRTGRVWSLGDGRLIATFTGHTDQLFLVEFSPDSRSIFSTAHDGTVRRWDPSTATQQFVYTAPHGHLSWADQSPDGRSLVTAGVTGEARLWNAGSPDAVSVMAGHQGDVNVVTFDAAGSRLLTGGNDGTVRIWQAGAHGFEETRAVPCEAPVQDAQLSSNEDFVVAAAVDGRVLIFDASTGALTRTFRADDQSLLRARFDPSGAHIVTAGAAAEVRVWDAATGRLARTLRGHAGYVSFAGFDPAGTRVLTAGSDGTARIWDWQAERLLRVLEAHTDALTMAAFDPSGTRVVTASYDGTAIVWDAATGSPRTTLGGEGRIMYTATFSRDGDMVLTASHDGAARLWDAESGALLDTFRSGSFAYGAAMSSTRVVVVGADSLVRVWMLPERAGVWADVRFVMSTTRQQ
jgi:WD40 repeat protein/tRNA A-37 threonylcarbamoyl transferase component Bud32